MADSNLAYDFGGSEIGVTCPSGNWRVASVTGAQSDERKVLPTLTDSSFNITDQLLTQGKLLTHSYTKKRS